MSNFLKRIFTSLFIENYLFIFNIFAVFRDINNYFYSLNRIHSFKNKKWWAGQKWRIDWLGMPYTVINYKDEFFESTVQQQKTILHADVIHILKEMQDNNMSEIVSFKYKHIFLKGNPTSGILVFFRPIFWYVSIRNLIGTGILIWLMIKNNFHFEIYKLLKTIITYIIS